jgi:hypothetical protein
VVVKDEVMVTLVEVKINIKLGQDNHWQDPILLQSRIVKVTDVVKNVCTTPILTLTLVEVLVETEVPILVLLMDDEVII